MEKGIFEGLKVLDCASFIAAPAAATVLSDFGADVIKIEPPGLGDPYRNLPNLPGYPASPHNFAWMLESRNKKSLALDLSKAEGRRVLYRLVGETDVFITNFPPAVRKRLGITYEELMPLTRMPALCCYGVLEEPDGEFCWLFLEDAAGVRYSPHLPHNRALAGRWLAETQLAAMSAGLRSCLPDRGLDHYLRLLRGCRATLLEQLGCGAFSAEDAALLRNIAAHLDALESRWGEVEKICEVMPRTLVHGDFVTKNLRIRAAAASPALLVFDWEFAGWGVPATDLAQFVDRVASPDLSLYCSILNGEQAHLDLRDIQAVAACGNLLRMIDQISWATAGQEFVFPAQLVKVIILLRSYESSILEALHAFERSWA